MICEANAREYCREPIENIKNYAEAVADTTQMWECHHINGRWWTPEELKKMQMYKNRPASELVFLTVHDHKLEKHASDVRRHEKQSLAKKGKAMPPEHYKKLSEAMKGENNPMFGKHSWNLGKHFSAETCKKIGDAKRGEKNPRFGKRAWNFGKSSGVKGKKWKLVDGKRFYY